MALLTTLVEEGGVLEGRTNLSSQEHLNVLAGGSHGGRGVGGRHVDRYRIVDGAGTRESKGATQQKDGSRAGKLNFDAAKLCVSTAI